MSRRTGRPVMLWMLLGDIVAPIVVYAVLRTIGASEALSLLAGGAVSAAGMLVSAVRRRRVDAMAAVVGGVFALELIALIVTGDARAVLAADSVPTVGLGLFFLGSVFIGRAVAFALLLDVLSGGDPSGEDFWRQAWDEGATFRRSLRTLTAVWAALLLAEGFGRLALIVALPLDAAVGASRALQVLLVLSMLAFAGWYAKRTGLGIRPYLDSRSAPRDE